MEKVTQNPIELSLIPEVKVQAAGMVWGWLSKDYITVQKNKTWGKAIGEGSLFCFTLPVA